MSIIIRIPTCRCNLNFHTAYSAWRAFRPLLKLISMPRSVENDSLVGIHIASRFTYGKIHELFLCLLNLKTQEWAFWLLRTSHLLRSWNKRHLRHRVWIKLSHSLVPTYLGIFFFFKSGFSHVKGENSDIPFLRPFGLFPSKSQISSPNFLFFFHPVLRRRFFPMKDYMHPDD